MRSWTKTAGPGKRSLRRLLNGSAAQKPISAIIILAGLGLGAPVFLTGTGCDGKKTKSPALLLNVNFGGAPKTGKAAVGLSAQDYWNNHAPLPWKALSGAARLKYANGEATTIGFTVDNAGGAWGNKSGDPMYDTYIYPNNGQGDGVGQVTVTLTNLPAGEYDFFLYGHADAGGRPESNSTFSLKSGAREFGPAGTLTSNGWKATQPWEEGKQYVRFRGVRVAEGAEVVITVAGGTNGKPSKGVAVINGFQVARAGLLSGSLR